jgi:hypothetical protein
VSEIWLAYIPAGTGSGVEIHFEFFFSITLGEDPARWSPCSLHNDLNFGLLIPLPVPAVGLRFILKYFFPSLGEDPARWSPCSLHNELSFGLLIPLPVPAVGLG